MIFPTIFPGARSSFFGDVRAGALGAGVIRPRRLRRERGSVSLPRDDRHVRVQYVAVGQIAQGPLRHHARVQHEQVPPAMARRVPGKCTLIR